MTQLGADPSALTDQHLEARSMLLVDDDEILRERLARALRERGFDVRTAANVDDAVQLAEADSPEYAVVDLRMPGKGGMELLRELQRVDAGTRALVLTGYGSIATAVEAVRLGAVNFIPKPADADDVCKALLAPPNQKAAPPDNPLSADRVRWEHIQRVLSDCGGNISESARRLGIHRRSLQRKLQRLAPKERGTQRTGTE
ncbi:MAG: response regulator [Planctomycetota bacterium]